MGRGEAAITKERKAAIYALTAERQPISVRGVAYQLFITRPDLSGSMKKNDTDRVSELLTTLRKDGIVPWEWITDTKHIVQRPVTWNSAEAFLSDVRGWFRYNYWEDQPYRVVVWSEKETVWGELEPVVTRYRVPFLATGGFVSTTRAQELAQESRESPVPTILLYVGDFDLSGVYMSMADIPKRLAEFGGNVMVRRLTLLPGDGERLGLPWFPVSDKVKDSRWDFWHAHGFGERCWEIDALDPRDLRRIVEEAILEYLDRDAWERSRQLERAYRRELRAFFDR
jgi:hypothetical protein